MTILSLISTPRLRALSLWLARFSGRWALNARTTIENTIWLRERLEEHTREARNYWRPGLDE